MKITKELPDPAEFPAGEIPIGELFATSDGSVYLRTFSSDADSAVRALLLSPGPSVRMAAYTTAAFGKHVTVQALKSELIIREA